MTPREIASRNDAAGNLEGRISDVDRNELVSNPRSGGWVVCRVLLVVQVLALVVSPPAHGWGYIAHRIVSEKAVTVLPGALGVFFRSHAVTVSDRSLEPDTVLKHDDPDEEPRHFINLEAYTSKPLDLAGLPRDLSGAVHRYGAKRLRKNGVLPWWIKESAARLRDAMKKGSSEQILREAGYLAHYVADLHQPLHLTRNYDGRETGNSGVHAAYERFMIERYARAYREVPVREDAGSPVGDPADWAMHRASQVYPEAARVLAADTAARALAGDDERRYLSALDARLRVLTRGLMGDAAAATALLWRRAWIEAGRPDPAHWTLANRVPVPAGKAGE